MSRTIGNEISPGRSASCGIGPTEIIWCTAGVSGIDAPAIRRQLRAPHAAGDDDRLGLDVAAGGAHPPDPALLDVHADHLDGRHHGERAERQRATPASACPRAASRPRRPTGTRTRRGSCPCPGTGRARRRGRESPARPGCPTPAPTTSAAAAPPSAPRCGRPRSRPDSVKTPSSLYWRIESRVRSVSSREWSTGKMKFDACPVEPPGLGSAPLSIWTMSRQPRRARWCTRLLPTMPAPITTTRAVAGTSCPWCLSSSSRPARAGGGSRTPTAPRGPRRPAAGARTRRASCARRRGRGRRRPSRRCASSGRSCPSC